MRLQTDQEFKQRNIEELNEKFNVEMYSTNLRGGKAFAAEQKIRQLKTLLLRSKWIEKFKDKPIKPNELIKKATFKLNNTRSARYGCSPDQIEEQVIEPEMWKYFQEVYDFHCLIKLKENRDRAKRFDAKVDRCKKRLKDPLEIGEKVLVLAERLRKKTLLEDCIKTQQKIKAFLTDRTFIISERLKLNNNTCLYWFKENDLKIKNRFLRQELFVLKNQFVE